MAKLTTLQPRLKPATTHTPKRNWGKGRGGRAWRRLRDEILARDNYTCQCCGRVGGQLELDHIVNVAQGGTDDKSNLQILCHSCHKTKTQSESQAGGSNNFWRKLTDTTPHPTHKKICAWKKSPIFSKKDYLHNFTKLGKTHVPNSETGSVRTACC